MSATNVLDGSRAMSMIGELRQVPASLIPALRDPARRKDVTITIMQSVGLSLDKAWDALRHLIAEASVEVEPIMGGAAITAVDTGYGPPQLLLPAEVRDCASSLGDLDDADLEDEFDAVALGAAGVYPNLWHGDDHAATLAWLVGHLHELRAFYADAAARGHGVLFFLA